MKRLLSVLLILVLILSMSACGEPAGSSSEPATESSAAISSSDASTAESSAAAASEPTVSDTVVRVAALKGPTAMGMVNMMEEDEAGNLYDFTLVSSPDEITPLISQGQVDIAAVPANLASVLYNKTEGDLEVLAINTLGVLYIVENGNTVTSVEDLRGKTIFASGKGATPEYALNYMLSQNGIDPETDVTIEYKSEHAECVSALTTTENAVAMLPEPFVTTAQSKNDQIQVVLDITQEWEKLTDDSGNPATLVTGVTIVKKEFLEAHPDLVAQYMQDAAASVEAVNASPSEAAALMEKYDIVTAAVAEKAIPKCNITFIAGEDMHTALAAYLQVLLEQNPQSVGGALPDENFYFTQIKS